MNISDATNILDLVKFPGYGFRVHGDFATGSKTYLQATFIAADNDNPKVMRRQTTRKWLLSPFMTRSELVQTAFKCVLTSLEHEAREQFTYKGQRVFGPHFDVEALVGVCRAARLDARADMEGERA